MCSVNIIGSHDYLTAQMLAFLTSAFLDDTIVSAVLSTTDLIMRNIHCTLSPQICLLAGNRVLWNIIQCAQLKLCEDKLNLYALK